MKYQMTVRTGNDVISTRNWIYLVCITLFGALLRIFRLGNWSFWVDEIFTVQAAQNFGSNIRNLPMFALTEFPITSMIIGLFIRQDVNEWTARLGPALIGALTLPILFFAVRKMFDTAVSLITVFLLSISPWHIFWSQNARFYILMLLFYTLALFYFFWAIEENKFRYILLSLLFFGMAMSERLLAGFFVPIIVCYCICIWVLPGSKPAGLNLKNLGFLLVLGLLVGVFAGWTFITTPNLWQEIYFIDDIADPIGLIIQHIRGVNLHILIVGGVGGLIVLRQKDIQRHIIFLFLGALIPLIITLTLSLFQFTHGRYTFVSLTNWLILTAVTINTFLITIKTKREQYIALTILIALFLFMPLQKLYDYYTVENGGRIGWKKAFLYLEKQIDSDDILISNDPIVGQFYIGETFIDMHTVDERFLDDSICDLENNAWVVMGGKSRINSNFKDIIQKTGTTINITANNVEIYLVEPLIVQNKLHCSDK